MTTDPYTAGVLAAIHGWPVCPCAGWHYQRDWWAGYKDQRRVHALPTSKKHVQKQRKFTHIPSRRKVT